MHRKSIFLLGACLGACACAPTRVLVEVSKSGCPEFYDLSSLETRVLRRLDGRLCVSASSSGLPGEGEQVLELPSEGGEIWVLLLGYRKPDAGGCGDRLCDLKLGETCDSCPQDCHCGPCGDGTCNPFDKESCASCPADCGKCDCPSCEVGRCVRCQGLARVALSSETVILPLSSTIGCALDAGALVAAGLPEGAFVLSTPPCP